MYKAATLGWFSSKRDAGTAIRLQGVTLLVVACSLALAPIVHSPRFPASVWVFETAAVIALFSGVRVLKEAADLTETIHWMNGLMFFMFVLHPCLVIKSGIVYEPYHNKFFIAPYYEKACVIALIGTLSINIGYALAIRRTPQEEDHEGRTYISDTQIAEDDSSGLMPGLRGFTAVALGAAALAAVAGGSITSAFAKSDSLTSAYLYMAPLILAPVGCLWYAAGHAWENVIYKRRGIAIFAFVAVITALVGQRTGLITAAGPLLLTVVCLRRIRVPRVLAIVMLILGMFAFSLLRDISGGGATDGADGAVIARFKDSPTDFLLNSLNGSDTEMVDAIAVETSIVPSYIPFSPRQEVVGVLGAAVPRFLWADKPKTMDNRLNGALLGTKVNEASVAYSVLGEGWYAGGFLGVILIGGATGVVFARVRNTYRRSGRSLLATCLYAVATPVSVIHLRGGLAYTFAYCLFYVGPVLFLTARTRWRLTAEAARPVPEAGRECVRVSG